jgi:hypothetical protein
MDKLKINYCLDVLLIIAFIVVAITSVILFFRILPKQVISELHTIAGIIFILLSLVHIGMHFNWFVCITKNIFSKETKDCKK